MFNTNTDFIKKLKRSSSSRKDLIKGLLSHSQQYEHKKVLIYPQEQSSKGKENGAGPVASKLKQSHTILPLGTRESNIPQLIREPFNLLDTCADGCQNIHPPSTGPTDSLVIIGPAECEALNKSLAEEVLQCLQEQSSKHNENAPGPGPVASKLKQGHTIHPLGTRESNTPQLIREPFNLFDTCADGCQNIHPPSTGPTSTAGPTSNLMTIEPAKCEALHNSLVDEGEYIVGTDNILQPLLDDDRAEIFDESQDFFNNSMEVSTVPDEANDILPLLLDNVDNDIAAVGHDDTLDINDEMREETKFTKEGNTRKRRKFLLSTKERCDIKKQKTTLKHGVKEPCKRTCKLKCAEFLTEPQRTIINEEYWSLTKQEQKAFTMGSMVKKPVKRRTADCCNSRRNNTIEYYLKNSVGISQRVCKTFFLGTIGYQKNDSIVQVCTKEKGISPKSDKRGTRRPHNKIDREIIVEHIKSFNPSISHYRREHAPNRLYLPSDLSVTKMFDNFKLKNPNFRCSYDLYREEINKLNISFVNLGHEECELCEHYKLHKETCAGDSCQDCADWKDHIERATFAREEYKRDKESNTNTDQIIYSVDLQKVIMLPRLEMFKSVIFAQRLSVYNQTFAPLGSSSKLKIVPVLWHEGIRGRKQEDIISALHKFLTSQHARDSSHIVLWMDNCSSQNKNWSLYSYLPYIINSNLISATRITFKYFEPGHTFMSADSFHHSVEKSLKTKTQSKVYDFNDFVEAVSAASKNVSVQTMAVGNFYQWKNYMSVKKMTNTTPNRPYLSNIVSIEARRGSLKLFYKKKYADVWADLDFLQVKMMKKGKVPEPQKFLVARGISRRRKESVLSLFAGKSGVIPPNRLEFWENLRAADDFSEDEEENVV